MPARTCLQDRGVEVRLVNEGDQGEGQGRNEGRQGGGVLRQAPQLNARLPVALGQLVSCCPPGGCAQHQVAAGGHQQRRLGQRLCQVHGGGKGREQQVGDAERALVAGHPVHVSSQEAGTAGRVAAQAAPAAVPLLVQSPSPRLSRPGVLLLRHVAAQAGVCSGSQEVGPKRRASGVPPTLQSSCQPQAAGQGDSDRRSSRKPGVLRLAGGCLLQASRRRGAGGAQRPARPDRLCGVWAVL